MRVLLDEQACDVAGDSVAQAITAAATFAEKNGRMIVEVFIDGQPWILQGDDVANTMQESAEEVRLTSANAAELVCQTFDDASSALGDADGFQRAAAELLQAGSISKAMEKLSDAFSIWISVQQAIVMGAELANIELDSLIVAERGKTVTVIINELNSQLQSMRDALENKDVSSLSDTLLYDLPHVVEQWRNLLEDLRLHVIKAGQTKGD